MLRGARSERGASAGAHPNLLVEPRRAAEARAEPRGERAHHRLLHAARGAVLRDGRHDFFATFVRVLKDRDEGHFEVEPGVTAGDYLDGFWQGTRRALHDSGRSSATICVDRIDERVLGAYSCDPGTAASPWAPRPMASSPLGLASLCRGPRRGLCVAAAALGSRWAAAQLAACT